MKQLARILHVEDEPDIQAVAKLTLESIGGFTVLACSSGLEALDKISGFAPDLVLLDVMMLGLDGPATLVEMRKIPEFETVPIVFLTAKAQSHDIDESLELGAAEVVLLRCPPEQCHYGFGSRVAKENFNRAQALIHLLGIESDRLRESCPKICEVSKSWGNGDPSVKKSRIQG